MVHCQWISVPNGSSRRGPCFQSIEMGDTLHRFHIPWKPVVAVLPNYEVKELGRPEAAD